MTKPQDPNIAVAAPDPKPLNQTTVLLSILIVMVLIIGGVLTFLLWQNNQPRSTLSVSATAQKDIDQDIATIYFYLTFKGGDIKELNKKADESATKVLNYLLDSGIKNKEIETNRNSFDDYNMSQMNNSSKNASEEKQKVVEAIFKVNFTNFQDNPQKPNDILIKLGEFGVSRYSTFQYSLNESKNQEVCDGLQAEAIKKALENSQTQLNALGGGIITKKDVKNVTSCSDLLTPYPFMTDAMSSNDMTMSQGNPGELQNNTPPVLAGKTTLRATAEILTEYRPK